MLSKNLIKYVRQLEQKKYRLREGVFVAEGPKVVGDLLRAGFQPRQLLATSEWTPSQSLITCQLLLITSDELQKVSFLQHPQQVLGVFNLPQSSVEALPEGMLSLALDGVQDPGNLGTIIRIADWFGITHIFCSPDTADAWNPKVVQATMGSIAHVSLTYTELAPLLSRTSMPVYGTLLDGKDIFRQELATEGVIVMGNEGKGISAPIRQLVTHPLLIPCFNQGQTAESLNVAIATAITCAEFRRRDIL